MSNKKIELKKHYPKWDNIEEKNNIHRPKHYSNNGLTPVEAMTMGLFSKEETTGFLMGNIIKYIVRYKHKNYLEDLYKAKEYIDLLIKFESEDNMTCKYCKFNNEDVKIIDDDYTFCDLHQEVVHKDNNCTQIIEDCD